MEYFISNMGLIGTRPLQWSFNKCHVVAGANLYSENESALGHCVGTNLCYNKTHCCHNFKCSTCFVLLIKISHGQQHRKQRWKTFQSRSGEGRVKGKKYIHGMGNKQINIYFIGLFLSQAIVGLISICSYLREFTNKN